MRKRLAKILARYHKQQPYSWGMKQPYAAGLFGVNAAGAKNFCQELAGGELIISHGCLALSGFVPIISQREMSLREAAIRLLNQDEKASIAPGDLRDKLAMSSSEQKVITKLLVEEGIAISLGGSLMLSSLVNQFRAEVIALYQEHGVIELSAVRQRTGTSRNLAVAILEHFDSEGLTKRQGDIRVLAKNRD